MFYIRFLGLEKKMSFFTSVSFQNILSHPSQHMCMVLNLYSETFLGNSLTSIIK